MRTHSSLSFYWVGPKVCLVFSIQCLAVFNFSQNSSVRRYCDSCHVSVQFFEKTLKLVNFCAAILILKMKENMQHFQHIMLYFKKSKNATKTQKLICAVYGEGAVTD